MRFPNGIRKALDLYREKIEAVAGGWVDWENPVGCGAFGCVFHIWTQDPGYDQPGSQALITDRVLKLSADPTEGPVVSAIMKTKLDKQLQGLARWYGVWRIPEKIQKGPREHVWVILREEVQPLSTMSVGYPKWSQLLVDYNRAAHKGIVAKRPERAKRFQEDATVALGEISNFEETYPVAEAIEALGREDIVIADVHQGNLGSRIHATEDQYLWNVRWFDGKDRPALLIFDPGHSSAPEGTTVENLWKTSEAANPWMGGEAKEIEAL